MADLVGSRVILAARLTAPGSRLTADGAAGRLARDVEHYDGGWRTFPRGTVVTGSWQCCGGDKPGC